MATTTKPRSVVIARESESGSTVSEDPYATTEVFGSTSKLSKEGSPNSIPMPPPSQIALLGFVAHGRDAQKAVYGPPGASYDRLGNVYFDLGKGRKQWIGSYRDAQGDAKNPPKYWLDSCCCIM